jgi:hypothetical protein
MTTEGAFSWDSVLDDVGRVCEMQVLILDYGIACLKVAATEAGAWPFERMKQCVCQPKVTEKAPVSH